MPNAGRVTNLTPHHAHLLADVDANAEAIGLIVREHALTAEIADLQGKVAKIDAAVRIADDRIRSENAPASPMRRLSPEAAQVFSQTRPQAFDPIATRRRMEEAVRRRAAHVAEISTRVATLATVRVMLDRVASRGWSLQDVKRSRRDDAILREERGPWARGPAGDVGETHPNRVHWCRFLSGVAEECDLTEHARALELGMAMGHEAMAYFEEMVRADWTAREREAAQADAEEWRLVELKAVRDRRIAGMTGSRIPMNAAQPPRAMRAGQVGSTTVGERRVA